MAKTAKVTRRTPISKLTKPPSAVGELGTTGLKRYGDRWSSIQEEFLRELSGDRAIKTFREMRDNDPVIGAFMFAIEMLVRKVTWRVDGEDKQLVEFVESCTQDMSSTWEDVICEILSHLTYGWSYHEIVYKHRKGDVNDPNGQSRFTDGKIGWRKIPIRSQDSLVEWEFDDEGGIQGFVQSAPPDYNRVVIPINRSLLFRTGLYKGSPEGRSILRNAYRSWFIKKRVEEIEAIGIERDLAGIPLFYLAPEIWDKYQNDLKNIGRNLKRDEQDCLVLPLIYDSDGTNKQLTFELINSGGQRQLDVSATIDRYDRRIAMTVLADFLFLGQQSVGSWALASSRTELFSRAIAAILDSIASVFNRIAIPRLLTINSMSLDKMPKLVPGDLETPNLDELGRFITALAGSGAALFPDDDLENYLRDSAHLPPKDEATTQLAQPKPVVPAKKPGKGAAANETTEQPTPEELAAQAAANANGGKGSA